MVVLLVVVGVLAVVVHLWAMRAEHFGWQAITKPIPLLCLLIGLWPWQGRYEAFIVAGLGLSLLGDMLLLWAHVKPRVFVWGLLSFLLGHLAYIAAYLSVSSAAQPVLALLIALYGVLMGRRLWLHLGAMRWPVVLYITVICSMLWRAAALSVTPGVPLPRAIWALLGAALFTMSDSLLAFDRFVRPMRRAG